MLKGHFLAFACGALLLITSANAVCADFSNYSGKMLYDRFCASCHGIDARGDGPVAPLFKVEVPDLRMIAQRHGGRFPRESVERIVDGRHVIGAHGTRTMPVWGEAFALEAIGNDHANEIALAQIRKLVDYLEALQIKQRER